MRALIYIICSLYLTACSSTASTEQAKGISDLEHLANRLSAVSDPLLSKNAQICPSTTVVQFRDGSRERICATQILAVDSPEINAFIDSGSNGGILKVSTGLVAGLSDDELAFIVSHELAHHVARHNIEKGSLPPLELEADRTALFLMARAGFNMAAANTMLGKVMDPALGPTLTHPSYAQRIANLNSSRAEITALMRRGSPLVP